MYKCRNIDVESYLFVSVLNIKDTVVLYKQHPELILDCIVFYLSHISHH